PDRPLEQTGRGTARPVGPVGPGEALLRGPRGTRRSRKHLLLPQLPGCVSGARAAVGARCAFSPGGSDRQRTKAVVRDVALRDSVVSPCAVDGRPHRSGRRPEAFLAREEVGTRSARSPGAVVADDVFGGGAGRVDRTGTGRPAMSGGRDVDGGDRAQAQYRPGDGPRWEE